VYRWMFDVASPRLNGDGSFGGFIGSAIDVTDQKLAQQALEKVSGQLIEAREKERSRIARELHDDICQRQLHSSKLRIWASQPPFGGSARSFRGNTRSASSSRKTMYPGIRPKILHSVCFE